MKKISSLITGETTRYVLRVPEIIGSPDDYLALEKIIDRFPIPAAWADSRSGEVYLIMNKNKKNFDVKMAERELRKGGFNITRKEVS